MWLDVFRIYNHYRVILCCKTEIYLYVISQVFKINFKMYSL